MNPIPSHPARRRPVMTVAATLLGLTPLLAGCDSNPEGPTSPPASANPAGTDPPSPASKKPGVKTEGGPASDR